MESVSTFNHCNATTISHLHQAERAARASCTQQSHPAARGMCPACRSTSFPVTTSSRLLPPQPHCPTLSRVSTRRLCLPSPSSSTLCARFRRSVPHICPCVLNLSLALWSRRAIYIDLVQTSAYASRIPTNCGAAYCFPTQLADISENLIYMNQWKRL
jgi:hypothetical protein